MNRIRAIAATFWIGGLWVVGLLVAPVLFQSLDRVAAGMVAGNIFAVQAWVGLVCGVILLVDAIWRDGVHGVRSASFWLVLGMLVCTVVNHFAVTPVIVDLKQGMNHAALGMFGGGFATWHAISSLIYLLQSLLGLGYVLKQAA